MNKVSIKEPTIWFVLLFPIIAVFVMWPLVTWVVISGKEFKRRIF